MYINKSLGLACNEILTFLKNYDIQRHPEAFYCMDGELSPRVKETLSTIDKTKPWCLVTFSRGGLDEPETNVRAFTGYDVKDIRTKIRMVDCIITFQIISNSLATLERVEEMTYLNYLGENIDIQGSTKKEVDGTEYTETFICSLDAFTLEPPSTVDKEEFGSLYSLQFSFCMNFTIEDKLDKDSTARIHRIFVNDELAVSVFEETDFTFKIISED